MFWSVCKVTHNVKYKRWFTIVKYRLIHCYDTSIINHKYKFKMTELAKRLNLIDETITQPINKSVSRGFKHEFFIPENS